VNRWLNNPWHHSRIGEATLVDRVELLFGWQAPAAGIFGKLRTGTARWQVAIRQVQTTVNLADIWRSRTVV
jgi:hypothetical protein